MEDMQLPDNYYWCRKGMYQVQIELGCYEITDAMPLLEGFEEKEIDGKTYAIKSGYNKLEQNRWTTGPTKPFIITGTVGERWPVKPDNLSAYDVNPSDIGIKPIFVSTKNPSNQVFLVARKIPEGEEARVIPDWAFSADGKVDETQVMIANSPLSEVSHNGGDFIVAKHGRPEYWELPEEIRNSVGAAKLYDPRVVNGSVMETTYDVALTQEEINRKYSNKSLKKKKCIKKNTNN